MVNVALLSQWHVHAKGYAEEMKAVPFVNIKVLWDEDSARGEALAKELGCEFEPDLDKVLAREDIDAVSVTTPTCDHKEVMIKAAKAGKHIFTEKVLAIKPEDAEEIKKAVDEAGVKFLIALRRRTEPRLLYVKDLLDQGVIGKVTHLRVRDAHDGASSNWLPDTFYNVEQCGGGAMMDLGAHPMYLCLYYLGEPKFVSSVFTECCGKGVDDNCVSVLEYDNGAIAVSETSFVSKRCPFSLEINGTEGDIYLNDNMDGAVWITTEKGLQVVSKEEIPERMPQPPVLFCECLEEGKDMPFTVEDGLHLTKLMNAAYRSAQEGKKVTY